MKSTPCKKPNAGGALRIEAKEKSRRTSTRSVFRKCQFRPRNLLRYPVAAFLPHCV
jgi:hypothetical protein